MGDDPSLRIAGDITVSLWVRMSQRYEASTMVSKVSTDGDSGWLISTSPGGETGGRVHFGGRDGSGEWRTSGLGPKIDDFAWHHIVGQRAGSEWRLFVDAQPASSADAVTAGSIAAPGVNLNVGRDTSGPDDYLAGYIDELSIWDRALTLEEIEALYEEGLNAPPTEIETIVTQEWDVECTTVTFEGAYMAQDINQDGVNLIEETGIRFEASAKWTMLQSTVWYMPDPIFSNNPSGDVVRFLLASLPSCTSIRRSTRSGSFTPAPTMKEAWTPSMTRG